MEDLEVPWLAAVGMCLGESMTLWWEVKPGVYQSKVNYKIVYVANVCACLSPGEWSASICDKTNNVEWHESCFNSKEDAQRWAVKSLG